MIEINDTIPKFEAMATSEIKVNSEDFKGKNIILYFYPKDNTPGCTIESNDFKDNFQLISETNTIIYGISRDTLRKHENFKAKHGFPFELISDPDEVICNLFSVLKEKSMFGKKYIGIERSTYLFNTDSKLVAKWEKVKITGHVEEVIKAISSLS